MSTARKIDWEGAKQRLAVAQRPLADDPVHQQKVFRERALRLASRSKAAPETLVDVLLFTVGDEAMAIEVAALSEVMPYRGCTPLPGAAAPLLGVISHQGEIYTLIDLASRLGLTQLATGSTAYVLLVRLAGARLGLRVGEIQSIDKLPLSTLVPAGETSAGMAGQGIKGIWPDRLALLDAEQILRPYL